MRLSRKWKVDVLPERVILLNIFSSDNLHAKCDYHVDLYTNTILHVLYIIVNPMVPYGGRGGVFFR